MKQNNESLAMNIILSYDLISYTLTSGSDMTPISLTILSPNDLLTVNPGTKLSYRNIRYGPACCPLLFLDL